MAITDNFDRADDTTLGANWTDIDGQGCRITSNTARGDGSSEYNASVYTGATWNSNQSSQVTIMSGWVDAGPCVRGGDAAGGGDYYYGMWHSNGFRRIYRFDNGAPTLLANFDGTVAAGDVVKLTATGTTLELFRNGASLGTTTDGTYSGGAPGIVIGTGSVSPGVDDWEGTGEVTGGGALVGGKLIGGALIGGKLIR